MSMTTIKVTPAVRDQLNELARARGGTANSVLEQLLEEYLWNQRVEKAIQQMRNAPAEVWQDYMQEFRAWDSTLMDGLEDEPWQE